MGKNVVVKGQAEFFSNIDSLSRINLPNEYKSFLKEAMEYVLRDSTTRVPVDTGVLRASGRQKIKYSNKNGASGEVSYNAPYAIPVHEVLTSHHPVGEAKYLENAVGAIMPFFGGVLSKKISSVLRKRNAKDIRAARKNY